ncbi:unknown protein [Simkania negevensis Z]|uniref:Uncharacterized protein n=1 Tax=Simkania negevensis (strain ATCC VR-1471 / DSM 27360 / Z) TaxID=331113 RepID=F8L5G0_SIMNZ|nr:unknown protein [Simkania negevensis Z]
MQGNHSIRKREFFFFAPLYWCGKNSMGHAFFFHDNHIFKNVFYNKERRRAMLVFQSAKSLKILQSIKKGCNLNIFSSNYTLFCHKSLFISLF